MPVKYNRSGIQFLYPENWEIAEDQLHEGTRSVTVQAPGGAFWSVDLHPHARNSRTLAAQVLETMRQEYGDLEAEPVWERIGGLEAAGYDMQFYCLDFIVTARLRSLSTQEGTIIVLCQAEDREFERLEPVFRAMSESIFQNDSENKPI
jgi:hypothetical protein